jgi:chemotaxis protein histidine kinase CheA
MKKEKQLILEDGKAINAETRENIKELSRILKEERELLKAERMQMVAERKQRAEEMEAERKLKNAELETERKQKTAELEAERKQKTAELEAERKQKTAELEAERKQKAAEMKAEREQMKADQQDFMKRMDRLDYLFAQNREQIGGISRSNGEFCEEYFVNCFKENPTLLGEKYDRILTYFSTDPKNRLIPGSDPIAIVDEYDLIMQNCTSIALIEMKYKAGTDDVGKMFSKLHSFRTNFPSLKDYKIYLCLASFRFPKMVRDRAAKEGIVLIEQRGDKIEVISENTKTW